MYIYSVVTSRQTGILCQQEANCLHDNKISTGKTKYVQAPKIFDDLYVYVIFMFLRATRKHKRSISNSIIKEDVFEV